MGGHKERRATIKRREGRRSCYKRCPRCKKLRMHRIPGNWWNNLGESQSKRRFKLCRKWIPLVTGGPAVCHVCQIRFTTAFLDEVKRLNKEVT